MVQARGLAELAASCRADGLTVMVFTGFLLENLRAKPLQGSEELLAATDLLVDGPFVESKIDSARNWAGSTNQRFHFLGDAYRKGIEYSDEFGHNMELHIGRDGSIKVNGWPFRFGNDSGETTTENHENKTRP
jgi:anaerobic ribonucleoside-triphosphate reductase activating protein